MHFFRTFINHVYKKAIYLYVFLVKYRYIFLKYNVLIESLEIFQHKNTFNTLGERCGVFGYGFTVHINIFVLFNMKPGEN